MTFTQLLRWILWKAWQVYIALCVIATTLFLIGYCVGLIQ